MIVPCGIRDRGVTSLEREVGGKVDPIEVRDRLTDYIAERFEADIRVTEGQAARDTLDAFIHRSHVVTEAQLNQWIEPRRPPRVCGCLSRGTRPRHCSATMKEFKPDDCIRRLR